MDPNAAAGATGIAALAGGPVGAGVMAGVGLIGGISNYIAQQKRERELRAKSSVDYLSELYGRLRTQQAGTFAGIRAGAEMNANVATQAATAQARRYGITGMGEATGISAQLQSFLASRKATDALNLQVWKQAQDQQQSELAMLQGIMQTPYGSASPLGVALGGAGTGLEAWTNAKYADRMAGKDGN